MYEALQTKNLYDLSHTIAAPLLAETVYPWEALSGIHAFIARAGAALPAEEYDHPRETVWIHKTAKVAPTAFIGDDVINFTATVQKSVWKRQSSVLEKKRFVR